MIGILSALNEEAYEFRNKLEKPDQLKLGEFDFTTGKLAGHDVVLAKTGVGKVFSAMTTQKLIDTFSPAYLIFTGIAGAINKDLEVGDIIVATDCVQYDLDVTALGFDLGQVPYTNYRIFQSDTMLHGLAMNSLSDVQPKKGRILTGDKFLTAKNDDVWEKIATDLQGDAVEMEGAAVAQVCVVNRLPFLILRTISDKADHSAVTDFASFLPQASQKTYQLVSQILNQLTNERE